MPGVTAGTSQGSIWTDIAAAVAAVGGFLLGAVAGIVHGVAAGRAFRAGSTSTGDADHVRIMVGGIAEVVHLPARSAFAAPWKTAKSTRRWPG